MQHYCIPDIGLHHVGQWETRVMDGPNEDLVQSVQICGSCHRFLNAPLSGAGGVMLPRFTHVLADCRSETRPLLVLTQKEADAVALGSRREGVVAMAASLQNSVWQSEAIIAALGGENALSSDSAQ